MTLIIVHGNGLVAAQNKLVQIKKGFDLLSTTVISGKELDFSEAILGSSTGGLFSEKRLMILEDFDEKKIDLEKLPSDDPDLTLVIKINKTLTAASSLIKTATKLKAQIYSFSERDETNIFPFLDSLADKNASESLKMLNSYLAEWGGQYVLTMIFYMLRRLIMPIKNLPPFVIKRVESQRRNFSQEKITALYKEALETDFKIKSGLLDERNGLTLLVNKIIQA